MSNNHHLPSWQALSHGALSSMFFLAFLPVLLVCVPFVVLELGFYTGIPLNVPLNGAWVSMVLLLSVAFMGYKASSIIMGLFDFSSVELHRAFRIAELICAFGLMAYIFMQFATYHYVTPSGSVLYYIFYDYIRLLHDTGIYRPELPEVNPVGTWYSMQTYHPGMGAAASLFYFGEGLESYRQSFGILSGLFNVGAMAWLGLFSRQYIGLFLPGVALGFAMFAFVGKAGLAQYMVYIGSHDLPMLFFAVAIIAISLIVTSRLSVKTPEQLVVLAVFNLGVAALGVSLRPYLMGLAVVAGLFSLYWLYQALPRLLGKTSSLGEQVRYYFQQSGARMSALLVFIGTYWFVVLLLAYQTPVVYSHGTQFKHLDSYSGEFIAQFERWLSVILNDSDGYAWFSDIHFQVFLASAVLLSIAFIARRGDKRVLPYSLMLLLVSAIPLLTNTGTHWKSFFSVMVLMYSFLPILAVSCLLYSSTSSVLSVRWYIAVLGFASLIVVAGGRLLPTTEFDGLFDKDQAFRQKAAQFQRNGETMLVLRGGEPGGDGQSLFQNYYYWDNAFLFGDIDRIFTDAGTTLDAFICLLNTRHIGLIFNPTFLSMPNHSGQVAYDGIIALITENPQIFKPVVKRQDGYKGVLYQVNYPESTPSGCSVASIREQQALSMHKSE